MEVSVFKCEETGQLFEDKKDYAAHKRMLGKQKREKEQRELRRARIDELTILPCRDAEHIQHFAALVLEVYQELVELLRKHSGGKARRVPILQSMALDVELSNKHHGPLLFTDMKAQDFVFRGKVVLDYDKKPESWSDRFGDIFRYAKTGCGGIHPHETGYRGTYDIELPLSHFPKLWAQFQRYAELSTLEKQSEKAVTQAHAALVERNANLNQIEEEKSVLLREMAVIQQKIQLLNQEAEAFKATLLVQAKASVSLFDPSEKARLADALGLSK